MRISFALRLLGVLMTSATSLTVMAQRADKICGTAEYVVPETGVDMETARVNAANRARQTALADKYGTSVNTATSTRVENKNGKSEVDIIRVGENTLLGEWISDTDDGAKYEYKVDSRTGMQVIVATVCGFARKMTKKTTDLRVGILRGGTSEADASTSFADGDKFYMSVQPAVDGYLAVYLIDSEKEVFCIYPYSTDGRGCAPIRSGRRNVLFSQADADEQERDMVDEYDLRTERSSEFNQIVVVFSENKFNKANATMTEAGIASLSYTDFRRWLLSSMRADTDMVKWEGMVTISR